jgi:hypothetical protein
MKKKYMLQITEHDDNGDLTDTFEMPFNYPDGWSDAFMEAKTRIDSFVSIRSNGIMQGSAKGVVDFDSEWPNGRQMRWMSATITKVNKHLKVIGKSTIKAEFIEIVEDPTNSFAMVYEIWGKGQDAFEGDPCGYRKVWADPLGLATATWHARELLQGGCTEVTIRHGQA